MIYSRSTMPKCYKIYPNCTWFVPPEWQKLNIYEVTLTKVYWKRTLPVRVCFYSTTPDARSPYSPHGLRKFNLNVIPDSKAMASLYELLCYHSLEHDDPLLEDLLDYIHDLCPNVVSTTYVTTLKMRWTTIALQSRTFIQMILHIILKALIQFFDTDFLYFLCNPKVLLTKEGGRIQKSNIKRLSAIKTR